MLLEHSFHPAASHCSGPALGCVGSAPVPAGQCGVPLCCCELDKIVVVVVVMTNPSGTAYMGGQMSRRDEEFNQTLNPEGSVSPS